jgi:signal transduction histidine kinase
VRRETVRLLAITVVVTAVAASATTIVLGAAVERSAAPRQVVVIGDPTIADGPQVLHDMRRSAAEDGISIASAPTVATMAGTMLALVWILTGIMIFIRQPENRAGWVFLAIGMAWIMSWFAVALVEWATRNNHGALPLRAPIAVVGEVGLAPAILIPLLFLLFPDGRPPTPRWRWAAWALLGGGAVGVLTEMITPGPLNNFVSSGIFYENPFGIPPLFDLARVLAGVGLVVALGGAVACVAGVRSRFKRSTGEERQQLRWLVLVASIAGVLLLTGILITLTIPSDLNGANAPPVFPVVLGLLALTVALGIPGAYLLAITRYGLWGIDIVIRKALILAVLAVFFVAVYALIVGGVGALTQSTGNTALSFAAAATVAVLFQPALSRARRFADRVVYGERATPYEVLSRFGDRLGDTYAADDVLARTARVLAEGIGADRARVWLGAAPDRRAVAEFVREGLDIDPSAPDEYLAEVRHRGRELGALSVTTPANDPMDPTKEKLVADLASQAGLLLSNFGLLEDLRASRRRLVSAQDEERRRLERNIHDGAQQQLVALAVKARLAKQLTARDPAKATELLLQIDGETQQALEDLRDLARGIYPPLLADRGLVDALTAQARKGTVPTEVHAEGVGRYPQEVEAAVYFCALEALQNVAKYARADSVRIDLGQRDGHLEFDVADDGTGFDPARAHGSGLQGMRDRLEALGGDRQPHGTGYPCARDGTGDRDGNHRRALRTRRSLRRASRRPRLPRAGRGRRRT